MRRSYRRGSSRKFGGPIFRNQFAHAKTAFRALRLAKGIRKLINVEYKNKDTSLHATTVTSTPTVTWPCLVAQGTSDSTRNGDQFRAKGLFIKTNIEFNTSGTANQYVRIIVFLDKASNGVLPSYSDLIETGTSGPIRGCRNSDTGKRFKVLKDKVIALNSQRPSVYLKWYHKLDHLVEFRGNTGDITMASTGHLYVAICSASATDAPTMFLDSRLKFIDN